MPERCPPLWVFQIIGMSTSDDLLLPLVFFLLPFSILVSQRSCPVWLFFFFFFGLTRLLS